MSVVDLSIPRLHARRILYALQNHHLSRNKSLRPNRSQSRRPPRTARLAKDQHWRLRSKVLPRARVPLQSTSPIPCNPVFCGSVTDGSGVIKAFLVQISIPANHQNGKDTHLRGVKVFAPGQAYVKSHSTMMLGPMDLDGPWWGEEHEREYTIR